MANDNVRHIKAFMADFQVTHARMESPHKASVFSVCRCAECNVELTTGGLTLYANQPNLKRAGFVIVDGEPEEGWPDKRGVVCLEHYRSES